MKDEIKEILDKLLKYFKESNINDFGYEKDKLISYEEAQIILDYITNLQTIADNRMDTILKIEKYCIEEKEDLISGGEVCEDILKIVDELKGKNL